MVPTSYDFTKPPTSTPLAQAQVFSEPMAVGIVPGKAASAFWIVWAQQRPEKENQLAGDSEEKNHGTSITFPKTS